jgi:ankyrin repeat protein
MPHPLPALRLLACLLAAALLLAACEKPQEPTINLYRAIHIGDLDQIKRHIFWGTDVNQPGPDGDYPLHVAARRGRVVITRELLRAGARIDVTDREGRTPLHTALAEGKRQVAEVMFQEGAEQSPQDLLYELVRSGVSDRDSLRLLVARGADVNAPGPDGKAPLHLAAEQGDHLLAKRLVDLGANVNLPDAEGRTPLTIARTLGHRDTVSVLEGFGAVAEDAPAR